MRRALFLLFLLVPAFALYQFNFTLSSNGTINISKDYPTSEPNALFMRNGTLYISDGGAPAIFKYGNETDNEPVKISSSISSPVSIFVDEGARVYFGDDGAGLVRRSPYKVLYDDATPHGIFLLNKTFYLTDQKYDRVLLVSDLGVYISAFGKAGIYTGNFMDPADLDVLNDEIYIADSGNRRVEIYSLNFTYIQSCRSGIGGVALERPEGIFVDANYLYVADRLGSQVVAYTRDCYPVFAYNISDPRDIVIEGGKIYISQGEKGSVFYAELYEPDPAAYVNSTLSALPQFSRYAKNAEVAQALNLAYNSTVASEWNSAQFAFHQGNYGEAFYKAKDLDAFADISLLNSQLESSLNSTLYSLAQDSPAKQGVLALLSSGNYSGAYAKLIASAQVQNASQNAANQTSNQTNNQTQQNATPINTGALEQRLAEAKREISVYKMDFGTSEIEAEIGLAKTSQTAYSSAELMLETLEQKINLQIYKITAAQSRVSALKAELSQGGLFVDYSKAAALYSNATSLLYSSPEAAKAAAESGIFEAQKARSSAAILYALILIGGGTALLAIAAALYFFRRKAEESRYRFKGGKR